MKSLSSLVLAAVLISSVAPALADPVAVITNPAGSFAPVYPTIETPAGGDATEQPMKRHGIPIPIEKCPGTSAVCPK